MSLIKCPECGKEISDKSEKCIHCGYPLRIKPYACENIMGKEYDVSFLLDHSVSQVKQMKQLVELTGCDLFTAKSIVLKYHPTINEDNNKPHCPTCGSTNLKKISGLSKASSVAMWGLLSQKIKKTYHCNNCGYEW